MVRRRGWYVGVELDSCDDIGDQMEVGENEKTVMFSERERERVRVREIGKTPVTRLAYRRRRRRSDVRKTE